MKRKSRFGLSADDDYLADINVTPFVDILLVLLVVFMITAPLLTHTLAIQLPEGHLADPEPSEKQEPLNVEVSLDLKIKIDERVFELEQLDSYLTKIPTTRLDSPVNLFMDQGVTHGFLIKLMLAFKNAGFRHVGLVFNEETP